MTWTKENYAAKAKLCWEKATAQPRGSIEYFMNFALFCEHIVRSAIVSCNPALNAAFDDESLLYAAGVDPRRPPRTIELSKAINIARRLIPEISETEIQSLSVLVDFRNTEFHDDSTKFDVAVLQRIVPDCQVLALRMIEFAKEDPENILGKDDAKQFAASRDAKAGDRNKRVKALIETSKDRFFHLSKEEQTERRQAGRPSFVSAVTQSGRHIRAEKCPACAELGLLSGLPQGQSAPMLRDDDLIIEVRVIPDAFDCKTCELSVRGLDELLAAGFPHEFTSLDSVDVVEHFGIDPREYVDEEEIAREYYEGAYEYQDE